MAVVRLRAALVLLILAGFTKTGAAKLGEQVASPNRCTAAETSGSDYCIKSESGLIKAFSCPADFYQCSGVDWKSESNETILFELVDPEGDPPHPSLKFERNSINSAPDGVQPLWTKDLSCGTSKGIQEWSLKKDGKYFQFKLNSTCGAESHSVEAICKREVRVCTEAERHGFPKTGDQK